MMTPDPPTPDASRTDAVEDALRSVLEIVGEQEAEAAALRARLAEAEREAERTATRLHDLHEELQFATEAAASAVDQIQSLTETVRSLQEELLLARRTPAPRGAGPAAPAQTPADPLAAAFRQWCREGGALNGNPDLFADLLGEFLPDADVRTFFRDADSPARPVVLTDAPEASSAVAYWVVSHDGRHRLLPQPMGPHQFRELAPCFTGDAAPATLTDIEPAEIRPTAGGFELVQPGHAA